jgi:hypothetical protein
MLKDLRLFFEHHENIILEKYALLFLRLSELPSLEENSSTFTE